MTEITLTSIERLQVKKAVAIDVYNVITIHYHELGQMTNIESAAYKDILLSLLDNAVEAINKYDKETAL